MVMEGRFSGTRVQAVNPPPLVTASVLNVPLQMVVNVYQQPFHYCLSIESPVSIILVLVPANMIQQGPQPLCREFHQPRS